MPWPGRTESPLATAPGVIGPLKSEVITGAVGIIISEPLMFFISVNNWSILFCCSFDGNQDRVLWPGCVIEPIRYSGCAMFHRHSISATMKFLIATTAASCKDHKQLYRFQDAGGRGR